MKRSALSILLALLLASCSVPDRAQPFADQQTPTVPPLEPPLTEEFSAIAAPDFLTEEQQDLYRRARCLYEAMFGGDTMGIDDFPSDELSPREFEPYETAEVDGHPYLLAQGRYRRWDDFDAAIRSLFTDDFWDSQNRLDEEETIPIYRDIDGRLGIVELSRGSGYYYNENFPDDFRLDARTDDMIAFTLIGHYSPVWPREGESPQARDQRRARAYEYTLEFPIKMVLTDDGWRFEEFHSALAEEAEG